MRKEKLSMQSEELKQLLQTIALQEGDANKEAKTYYYRSLAHNSDVKWRYEQ